MKTNSHGYLGLCTVDMTNWFVSSHLWRVSAFPSEHSWVSTSGCDLSSHSPFAKACKERKLSVESPPKPPKDSILEGTSEILGSWDLRFPGLRELRRKHPAHNEKIPAKLVFSCDMIVVSGIQVLRFKHFKW